MELELLVIYIFVIISGACIGSFLNVVALRAISKESIVLPPSKCPNCSARIKWYDNIPVLSYLFIFRGKCRNCGCHVSLQYPIVEAVTALLFLGVFLMFGASLKTLVLLVLVCLAEVLIITDLKKEYLYDFHLWPFIIISILYSIFFKYGLNDIFSVCTGALAGALLMEVIARGAYFLVKKESGENKEQDTDVSNIEIDEENLDINAYVKKYKRVFGEGDSYLAAGVGALLGWKYLILAVMGAVIVQALCILPQFFKSLYDKKEFKLLASISAFIFISLVYWLLSNIFYLNDYVRLAIVILLIFFAIDSILRLKKSVNEAGFKAIPFGPALLVASFIILFYGNYITQFLKRYIFFI